MKYQSRNKNNTGVLASVFMWILLVILLSIGIIGLAKADEHPISHHLKCAAIAEAAGLAGMRSAHIYFIPPRFHPEGKWKVIWVELMKLIQVDLVKLNTGSDGRKAFTKRYKEECL